MAREETALFLVEQQLLQSYMRLDLAHRTVLLAVSGGADSSALLHGTARVAARIPMSFEVAALDHRLRPEGAVEASSVEAQCLQLGVPCHVRALDLAGPSSAIEERAREARYSMLERIRVERGLDLIATAHTANDQAETLLMRLARGAALKGAAAIRERRGTIVRPMLRLTRTDVLEYLRERGLSFFSDPMNTDPNFLRVRIRRDVLPVLNEAAGPHATEALARFASLAEEDEAFLSDEAERALMRISLEDGDALDRTGLVALAPPIRRRVLVLWLGGQGQRLDGDRLAECLGAIAQERGSPLAGREALNVSGGRVRIAREHPVTLGEVRVTQTRPAASEMLLHIPVPPGANGPFSVRTRHPGDRVQLPDGHTRKLQDVLVDERVSREKRDALPLVVDAGGKVVWIPGVWAPRNPAADAPHGWLVYVPENLGG